jgi:hypothetical protein
MRCRHAVFDRRIAGFTLLRADLAVAGQSSLKLRLNLAAAALLERISATGDEGESGERAENG